jgi:zinc protease
MIRLVCAFAAMMVLALPARAIDIQEVTSPGGLKAWLVQEPSIPFTALQLRFKGGAALDRPGKRGSVYLMSGLIEEGAGDLNAREFAAAQEALAASFSYRAFDDGLSISAKFLTENRDEAVALLKLALTQANFDEDAVARVKSQVLSGIASDLKDPNKIAGVTFDRMAFGDHPYGSAKEGSVESVTALTREDVVTAYRDVLTKERVFVGAVGDISAEELGALMDDLLGGLPETGAPLPGRADYALDGGVTVVDFPTPQSVAVFGHEGLTRDDPDFFAAFVMNQILGAGGFGSRLMEEVREKRGLTYGVSTYLLPMDNAELFLGQVASANDRVGQAMSVIRSEWAKLASDGVTEDELEDAKKYLTGAYPLRFDGNTSIARILVGMQEDGLPKSYIDTRNAKVEAVTLADIRRVAARLLQPDALHFVVVGQPTGVKASN